MKCIVKGCENHKHQGGFEDGMCLPCYLFITTGEGIYSQAYRNSNPVKELTDDELFHAIRRVGWTSIEQTDEIVEAIRKAQER